MFPTPVLKHLTAKWQQNIGPSVSSHPGPRPKRVILEGKSVTVVPLTPGHADDLYTIVQGDDKGHIWTYLGDEPPISLEAFKVAVAAKSLSEDPLFFAIVENKSQKPVGWATFMRIDTKSRVVEVGNILFSPLLQRTKAATEAMYLMAKYVFEDLQYRRYEWKCDNLNTPSKRAAVRLGFTFEGIFRRHMVYKNRSRDTAWFSLIDEDWMAVKQGFEKWLDDANFDRDGRQKQRLEELREELKNQKGPVILEL